MKTSTISIAILLSAITFTMSGCANKAPKPPKLVKKSPCCYENHYSKAVVKVEKKYIKECPKRVKTLIYKDVCTDCNNFIVTVREKNCCENGGC